MIKMFSTKEIYWKENEENTLHDNFSNSSKQRLLKLLPKRTWKSITRKAERMNLRRMNYLRSLKPKNHHFFKKWSEEMAYILGFITADGHIRKNNKSYNLQFSIHEKDKDILEKIRGILAPKNNAYYFKKEKMYNFSFASTTMYDDLIKLGIKSKKTFTVKPPKIPKKYIRHYLRGYFDGDGSISLSKAKHWRKKVPGVSITGNIQMVSYTRIIFNKLTNSQLNIYETRSKYGNSLGSLQYTCRNAVKILDFLYKDSIIYLDRKFRKYKYIKEVMGYENST